MTTQCRNVLKGLRRLSSNEECVLGFLQNTSFICLQSDISKQYDYAAYKKEIHGIINQLTADGFLACAYDPDDGFFILTHKGLHPYQIQWEALKSFLIRSILVPIVVSFLTSIATVLSQAWLSSL